MDSMTLRFGQYRGSALDAVPAEYLEFLRGQSWLLDATRFAVEEERRRRARADRGPGAGKRPLPGPRPADPADERRLLEHGWQRSRLGYWSRWVVGKKRPGWCCCQISPRLALVIQDWLDGRLAKAAKRRAA
jgi:hypothetical protein